ncbi:MAG: hypothetical protein FWF72_04385 [Paludibacter sp.]|nr:hypothetical protein [Paludibacter sp.]
MENKTKIELTCTMGTLFICLRAKALDSQSKNYVLHDTHADKILQSIEYDFSNIAASASFDGDMPNVWRAKHIDDWIKEFIRTNPNAVVLNLGCREQNA